MIYDLSKMEEVDVLGIQLSVGGSYLYFHKSLYYEGVVQHLLKVTEGRWEKAVRWFVTNSARTVQLSSSGFKVSLKTSHYSGNVMGIGYKAVRNLLDLLEKKSYIHIYKGFVKYWSNTGAPEEATPSCIVFRKRFLDLWVGVENIPNLFTELEREECVQVRDRKTKEPKSGWEEFLMEDVDSIMKYNSALVEANITFRGKRITSPKYNRIYIEDVNHGGRVYAAGGGVQLLPQEIRSEWLQIEGESVVELDYSSIHPNICYQLMQNKGVPVLSVVGEGFSPYSADLSFVQVDEELKAYWERETGLVHNPLRSLAKLAILIGMNAVDKKSAVGAMASKVRADRKRDVKDQMFFAIKGSIPVSNILTAVQEHNDFINEHFFNDHGIILQKYDSDVCMKVIETVIQAGESLLCYHDSFLVRETQEEVLRAAMESAWESVFYDKTFCKIDKK